MNNILVGNFSPDVTEHDIRPLFERHGVVQRFKIMIDRRTGLTRGFGFIQMKTDAEAGDNAQEVPAFNSIHDNQVVGTTNYGIQFAAGHDNVAANNRVISSGLLADGTKIAAQNVGMANSDATGSAVANGSMYNNTMHDNLIGWTCWNSACSQSGYRKDQSFPASPADYSTNSVLAPQQCRRRPDRK